MSVFFPSLLLFIFHLYLENFFPEIFTFLRISECIHAQEWSLVKSACLYTDLFDVYAWACVCICVKTFTFLSSFFPFHIHWTAKNLRIADSKCPIHIHICEFCMSTSKSKATEQIRIQPPPPWNVVTGAKEKKSGKKTSTNCYCVRASRKIS